MKTTIYKRFGFLAAAAVFAFSLFGADSLGAFKAEPKILKTSGTIKEVRGDWMTQSGAGRGKHTQICIPDCQTATPRQLPAR